MTTELSPLAWHRAVALAHACGLDWGAWALGYKPTPEGALIIARTLGGMTPTDREREVVLRGTDPIPVPARIEDTRAPYLADCRRRGVEPGELPALWWSSASNDVAWSVSSDDGDETYIRVGHLRVALAVQNRSLWDVREGVATPSDLARLSTLVTAAAQAGDPGR